MPAQPNAVCCQCGVPMLAAINPQTRAPESRWPGADGRPTCGRYCPKGNPRKIWPPGDHTPKRQSNKINSPTEANKAMPAQA